MWSCHRCGGTQRISDIILSPDLFFFLNLLSLSFYTIFGTVPCLLSVNLTLLLTRPFSILDTDICLGGWSVTKVSEFKACFPRNRCSMCPRHACRPTADFAGSKFPSAKSCDSPLHHISAGGMVVHLYWFPGEKNAWENSDNHWTNKYHYL